MSGQKSFTDQATTTTRRNGQGGGGRGASQIESTMDDKIQDQKKYKIETFKTAIHMTQRSTNCGDKQSLMVGHLSDFSKETLEEAVICDSNPSATNTFHCQSQQQQQQHQQQQQQQQQHMDPSLVTEQGCRYHLFRCSEENQKESELSRCRVENGNESLCSCPLYARIQVNEHGMDSSDSSLTQAQLQHVVAVSSHPRGHPKDDNKQEEEEEEEEDFLEYSESSSTSDQEDVAFVVPKDDFIVAIADDFVAPQFANLSGKSNFEWMSSKRPRRRPSE